MFRLHHAVVAFAFVLFAAIVAVYIQRAFIDVYYLDGLMMVPILEKFYQGTIQYSDWMTSWEQHRLPGYVGIFILNAKVFGLNAKVEPHVFLLSFCIVGAVLYRPFVRFIKESVGLENGIPVSLAYVVILSAVFSLAHHPFHLMTTQFVLGNALFVVAVVMFDKICRGDTSWRVVALYLATVAVYLLFSGAYMGGGLMSLVACFSLVVLINRRVSPQLGAAFVGSLVLMAIYILSNPQGATGGKIIAALRLPFETFMSMLTGLSISTIDQHTWVDRLAEDPRIIVLNGGFMLLVGLFALYRFFVQKLWRYTYIPVLLMVYTAGTVLTIRLGRVESGWLWPVQNWYAIHSYFYLVGVLWILTYDVLRLRVAAVPAITCIAAILAIQTYSNLYMWQEAPHVANWLDQKREAMLDPTPEKLKILYWEEADSLKAIEVLKNHKLSLFRDTATPGSQQPK